MKAIIDYLFGTETRTNTNTDIKPIQLIDPPIIVSMFDPIKYNIEENKQNNNLHDRIEWRKRVVK